MFAFFLAFLYVGVTFVFTGELFPTITSAALFLFRWYTLASFIAIPWYFFMTGFRVKKEIEEQPSYFTALVARWLFLHSAMFLANFAPLLIGSLCLSINPPSLSSILGGLILMLTGFLVQNHLYNGFVTEE